MTTTEAGGLSPSRKETMTSTGEQSRGLQQHIALQVEAFFGFII